MGAVSIRGIHGSIALIGGGTLTGGGPGGTAAINGTNCKGKLSSGTHNQGLGFSLGSFGAVTTYPDPQPNYDCEFDNGDYVKVKTWAFLFFGRTTVTFHLQMGSQEASAWGISLGLGFHRFLLTISDVNHI